MRLGTHQECVGSSPRVSGVCYDSAERVHKKKTETRRKIIGGSRKAYRDSDDEVGSRQEFTKRFTEGIRKLTGNMKGDRREEARRTYRKNVGGYRLCGTAASRFRRVNRPYHRIRAAAND
ncbi:hypothetical protein BHE74_00058155 [Ensete ventricosum]|nr:hypothetical protein BHE74_00058155 [Ensete ventricosum]RZS27919.1 hypothetical protein BHM03_00061456 [Ensete ventricosum]